MFSCENKDEIDIDMKINNEDKDEIVMRIINEDVESIIIRTLDIKMLSVEDVLEYFLLPKTCYKIDHMNNRSEICIGFYIKKIKDNNFLYDYQLKNVLKYLMEHIICLYINYSNEMLDIFTYEDFT